MEVREVEGILGMTSRKGWRREREEDEEEDEFWNFPCSFDVRCREARTGDARVEVELFAASGRRIRVSRHFIRSGEDTELTLRFVGGFGEGEERGKRRRSGFDGIPSYG